MTPLPVPLRAWLVSRQLSICVPVTSPVPDPRIMVADIQAAVARHFGITVIDLISERRAVAIARPRQIAMYLAKRLTLRSLPDIGRRFGDRDHSTVIHAVRRIEGLRVSDADIDNAVRSLTRRLKRRRN